MEGQKVAGSERRTEQESGQRKEGRTGADEGGEAGTPRKPSGLASMLLHLEGSPPEGSLTDTHSISCIELVGEARQGEGSGHCHAPW